MGGPWASNGDSRSPCGARRVRHSKRRGAFFFEKDPSARATRRLLPSPPPPRPPPSPPPRRRSRSLSPPFRRRRTHYVSSLPFRPPLRLPRPDSPLPFTVLLIRVFCLIDCALESKPTGVVPIRDQSSLIQQGLCEF
jgi:hypothetical protein